MKAGKRETPLLLVEKGRLDQKVLRFICSFGRAYWKYQTNFHIYKLSTRPIYHLQRTHLFMTHRGKGDERRPEYKEIA
jgi:hypothetical protein